MAGKDGGSPQGLQSQEKPSVWQGFGEPDLSLLDRSELMGALEEAFKSLHSGRAVQPPQTLSVFPEGRGDFIAYLGVIENLGVFGVKVSPYMPELTPSVTAWTLLMGMETGAPLLLASSKGLTVHRTAATTALAVKLLAKPSSGKLAIIGSGPQALAHLQYAAGLRDWRELSLFSPSLSKTPGKAVPFLEIFSGAGREASVAKTPSECARGADAVLLCTSSGSPVIDLKELPPGALVTSISTNLPQAREIAPEALPKMDVYCDYRKTTPSVAGEMVLASKAGIWSEADILADLPALCAGAFKPEAGDRPVFFRSVGLGLEDVAAAYALYKSQAAS